MDNQAMEPIYRISQGDYGENKENTVLNALVGDSNRFTPRAQHLSPSRYAPDGQQPTSMYAPDTRYQQTPMKASSNHPPAQVYYIESNSKEGRHMPPSTYQDNRSNVQTAFLAPHVISQPILYSIGGVRNTPMTAPPTSVAQAPASPTLYSITQHRPRRPTVDTGVFHSEMPTPIPDQPPTLYTVIASPRYPQSMQAPMTRVMPPSPSFYSIVTPPTRASRGTQVETPGSIEPAPIMYTVVGDNHTPRNTPGDNRAPPVSVRKQPKEVIMYNVDDETRQYQYEKPTLYNIVSKPFSPMQPNISLRTKTQARKTTPPPPIKNNSPRRSSRSPEKKPEPFQEEQVSYPPIKSTRSPPPKSDQQQQTASYPSNNDPSQRKPYVGLQDFPIQLPDYHSPYAYRGQKGHQDRNFNQTSFPAVPSNRKARPPLHEPRYRAEPIHYHGQSKAISLERNPVRTKPSSGLWDSADQIQTDDDDEYEQRLKRKKVNPRRGRPRTPWIPVW